MTMISNNNTTIPILLNDKLFRLHINKWETWNTNTAPHVIIVGATGSGKTYLSQLLLGKIALYVHDAEIVVMDFKGDDDFLFLKGCKNCCRYAECEDGFQRFFNRFADRQQGKDTSRKMLVLFFDEWASYLNYQDKKQAEEEKRKMANLLMLGRSFNVHVIISQQRADAQYFSTARDNLNVVIGLGNLSEESKDMLFHEYKKEMLPNRERGTGYMLTNGTNLQAVIVPHISNMEKLHRVIRNAVS